MNLISILYHHQSYIWNIISNICIKPTLYSWNYSYLLDHWFCPVYRFESLYLGDSDTDDEGTELFKEDEEEEGKQRNGGRNDRRRVREKVEKIEKREKGEKGVKKENRDGEENEKGEAKGCGKMMRNMKMKEQNFFWLK